MKIVFLGTGPTEPVIKDGRTRSSIYIEDLKMIIDVTPDFFTQIKKNKVEEIQDRLIKSVGKFVQKYPAYSSKPVLGPSPLGRTSKPLFQWAREGRIGEIEIPEHEVEVFEAEFLERREISEPKLLEEIKQKISKVTGDFRQKEILSLWSETLSRGTLDTFTIDRILVKVSSGFYVRQFVSDLAESLGTKALTFHIKRTKVGDFDVEDCV